MRGQFVVPYNLVHSGDDAFQTLMYALQIDLYEMTPDETGTLYRCVGTSPLFTQEEGGGEVPIYDLDAFAAVQKPEAATESEDDVSENNESSDEPPEDAA